MDNLMLRRRILLGLLDEEYIIFADPVVEQICANAWGDGVGLKPRQAAAVSSVNTQFAKNTLIEYFDELSYFTGLTSFGQNTTSAKCFSGCTNLKSVNIPEGIVTIVGTSASGNYANAIPFRNCSSLERIGFPSTLRKLGQDTSHWHIFDGCTALARVDIPSVDNYLGLSTGNGVLCNPFGASTAAQRGLYVNGSLVENITVPSTITSINKYLFSNNNTIKTVQFHSSLTFIGEGAFRGCSGLTSVTIPSSVTSIGNSAFNGCSGLTGNMIVPSTVTSLGTTPFGGCTGLSNLYNFCSASVDPAFFNNVAPDGVIYCKGNCNGSTSYSSSKAHTIIIGGYSSSVSAQRAILTSSATVRALRVWGNINRTVYNGSLITSAGSNTKVKIVFVELLGKFMNNDYGHFYSGSGIVPANTIIHLGYDTITNNELPCTPTRADAGYSNVVKIYVGTGESLAKDQAILDMYLADTDWAAYSSKLDL